MDLSIMGIFFLLLNNTCKYLVIEVIERVLVYKYLGFFLEEKHQVFFRLIKKNSGLSWVFFSETNVVSLLMQEKKLYKQHFYQFLTTVTFYT